MRWWAKIKEFFSKDTTTVPLGDYLAEEGYYDE